jgi:N-carbamoylputrescine amidase
MREVVIGLVFVAGSGEDKEGNYRLAEGLIRRAAAQGAQIVLTPEAFLSNYLCLTPEMTRERFLAAAEPLNGPYVARLRSLAAELEIYLVPCLDERDGDQVYCTALLIDPKGTLVGSYRKVHLGEEEWRWWAEGSQFPVFGTTFGRVGMMICFDRQLPETARVLALQGAELILVPAAGAYGEKKYERNLALMKTRAYENRLFVAMAHPTEGLIVNPMGEVLARKGLDETVLVRRVDLDCVYESREGHGSAVLTERRPELYSLLTRNASKRR